MSTYGLLAKKLYFFAIQTNDIISIIINNKKHVPVKISESLQLKKLNKKVIQEKLAINKINEN